MQDNNIENCSPLLKAILSGEKQVAEDLLAKGQRLTADDLKNHGAKINLLLENFAEEDLKLQQRIKNEKDAEVSVAMQAYRDHMTSVNGLLQRAL